MKCSSLVHITFLAAISVTRSALYPFGRSALWAEHQHVQVTVMWGGRFGFFRGGTEKLTLCLCVCMLLCVFCCASVGGVTVSECLELQGRLCA